MHVLGIDVGGTRTTCVLADADGRTVATAQGPGANLQSAGELELEKVLHAAMEDAIGSQSPPSVICLGIAGVDRPEDSATVHGILRRIGYKARILVVNDALVALRAGIGDAAGIVIVAGTGSIVYGHDGRGQAARAGGWGHMLGDEGSGYWIGRLALRAIVRQADGRGEPTALTDRLLAHFGVRRPEDLIQAVYRRDLRPSAIAALAKHVQQAHDTGDRVSTAILARAAEELLGAAAAVTARLGLTDEQFTFVLAGGIFQGVPWLARRLTCGLPAIAKRSTTLVLSVEPALGAVQLACAELRGGAALPVYMR
jgi:N-acetylglucosamine kinase-like BadF-type ATPase